MLSPYRGVMHAVVHGWADAVTTDGRAWTLYERYQVEHNHREPTFPKCP